MLLIGGGALVQSLQYGLGTPGEVGSGFFPAAVSGVLALLGLAIVLRARIQTGAPDDVQVKPFRWEWRGWLCIMASATFRHSMAKWPVSTISTRSPGDSVLTMADSQAPVPEDG